MRFSNNFYELDFILTSLVKKSQDELIKVIESLLYISVTTGIFSESIKAALLKSLIKEANLD